MISEKDAIKVESNVQGDKITMGIDQESFGHVMDLLANAYGDPMTAVIREYATNGRDATIEAGRTDAIEVTLPNHLAPTLSIRDYGVGLSKEDIASIYSQYGASTKRGTNSQTGMLGIGCKSALAYAPQFTVQSRKGGRSITVLVSRDEDGGGSMTVMDERDTTEREGTTIMVPVQPQHTHQFAEKAGFFFSFWPQGSVLVDGEPPKRFQGLKLRHDLYVAEDATNDVVVMGNVPYPANLGLSIHIIAFVPIGAVAFPPSRESLKDTPKTRATLQQVKDNFDQSIKGAIQREVNAAKTGREAISIVTRWRNKVPGSSAHGYTWKGVEVPRTFQSDKQMLVNTPFGYGRKSYVHSPQHIADESLHVTLFVSGFAPDTFTAQHHNKLIEYCKQQKINVNRYDNGVPYVRQFVLLRGDAPKGDLLKFIPKEHITDWDTIRAVKLPTNAPVPGRGGVARIPGSYDLYTERGYEHGVPGDKIRQDKPIFWLNGNRYETDRYQAVIRQHVKEFTLVCLPANRIDKFCRILPKAKTAMEGVKEAYAAWTKGLKPDLLKALTLFDKHHRDWSIMRELDPKKVQDPVLSEAIRISRLDISATYEARKRFQSLLALDTMAVKVNNPLPKYPLVRSAMYRSYSAPEVSKAHVYLYLNTVYALDSAGKSV